VSDVDQRQAVRAVFAHGWGKRAPVTTTPARAAAAVIANQDHTAATVGPIAVVDFYPAPKDAHEHR
jgi:hypothetical protein